MFFFFPVEFSFSCIFIHTQNKNPIWKRENVVYKADEIYFIYIVPSLQKKLVDFPQTRK